MTLTTSVLGSLGIYLFSLFRVPASILSKLESLRSKFFWGGNSDSKKMTWIKWPLVLAPKAVGGLGVGSLKAFNLALLYKWRWRFLTDSNSLWARVIRSIHGLDSVFTFKTKQGGLWSRICTAIATTHDQFSLPVSVITRQVGDGHNTKFWKDPWIGDSTLANKYPRLFALDRKQDCCVSDRHMGGSWSWDWRRNLRGGVEETQMTNLILDLQPIILTEVPDSWRWNLSGNTCFSVSDIRQDLELSLLLADDRSTRWNSMVPKKINVFNWRMEKDRLPTRFNLSAKGIDIPSISCPLCNMSAETSTHLFKDCNFSIELRNLMSTWLQLDLPDANPTGLLDWIANLQASKKYKTILEAICLIWWWAI